MIRITNRARNELMKNINGLSRVIINFNTISGYEHIKSGLDLDALTILNDILIEDLNFACMSVIAPTRTIKRFIKSQPEQIQATITPDYQVRVIDDAFLRGRVLNRLIDRFKERRGKIYIRKLSESDILLPQIFPLLEADIAHENGLDGSGIKVSVIDTGVDVLNEMVGSNIQFSELKRGESTVGIDDSGHGTWTTTCIGGRKVELDGNNYLQGIAYNSEVLSIKSLYTPMGVGFNSDILKAIEDAYTWGADVISMSLGGPYNPEYKDDPGVQLCERLSDKGIIICAASGNDGASNSINTPGCSPGAISVGSVTIHNPQAYSDFSSRGPLADGTIKPDCCAYGGNAGDNSIPSETILCASSGMLSKIDKGKSTGVAALMGTSMATPQVAAIMALWKQYVRSEGMDISINNVLSILERRGHAKNSDTGYGPIKFSWIYK